MKTVFLISRPKISAYTIASRLLYIISGLFLVWVAIETFFLGVQFSQNLIKILIGILGAVIGSYFGWSDYGE